MSPVTWLAQPVFVPVPVVPPVGNSATFTATDSQASFEAACDDLDLTHIYLSAANGNFGTAAGGWQDVNVDVDRTGFPLWVGPTPGHDIIWDGDATSTGIILNVGQSTLTKHITFSGQGGSWTFQDTLLAQSGVIEVRGGTNLTFEFLTFSNIGRDLGVPGTGEHKSWMFYISAAGSGNCDEIVVDNCRFKAPAAYRDVSGIQIDSSGSHGHITVSNVLEMTEYHYAFFCGRPVTNVELVNWVMTDCGRAATPASIRFADFGAGYFMAGSYTNIDATLSDPFADAHSGGGTITDGGGNSGI